MITDKNNKQYAYFLIKVIMKHVYNLFFVEFIFGYYFTELKKKTINQFLVE